MSEAIKPVKMLRRGAVAVSVWRREHEGKVFYSATPSRAYKPQGASEDDPFEYSDSFNADDLPTVAELLRMAFAWIVHQSAAAK